MAVNPLPPQAYTKETLQKAYTWLLTQSASIKEMASSQDMLISLYLKAQRSGDASLETPSIQNFKQELKSLAGIMGDLQVPSQSVPPSHMPPAMTSHAGATHSNKAATAAMSSHSSQTSSFSQPTFLAQPANLNPAPASSGSLDSVSMQFIQEVKQGLNLSSDAETLRALIAMGYKQFKKM